MTFPTIPTVGAGRVLTAVQADTTATRTFASLTGLTKNAGDLLIAIVLAYQTNINGDVFASWSGGFTEFFDDGSNGVAAVAAAYKISTGAETGTHTVSQGGTVTGHAALITLSIPGISVPPQAGSLNRSLPPDPGSFSPSWGTRDTLWIAVALCGETSTTGSFTGVASAPTNYSDYADTGISADVVGGIEGAVAFRQLAAASEDQGAFTMDTTNARGAGFVIAVRPVEAAALPIVVPSQAVHQSYNW